MTRGVRIPRDELHLDLVHFGITQWCSLVGHDCAAIPCHCGCHQPNWTQPAP